jgi:ribosomal-protein-alanine N-acetyltransferase
MDTLRTARLTLRPLQLSDADDLFTVRGDPEAMAFWDWPADPSPAATRDVTSGLLDEMASGEAVYWTAILDDCRFAGLFDLSGLKTRQGDLGFMVPARLWGQGLGREGAGAVVQEAWRRGLNGLRSRIHAANHRSERLLLGLGFAQTGPDGEIEVRPGVKIACRFFQLGRPRR